jgi:hypothetical protein
MFVTFMFQNISNDAMDGKKCVNNIFVTLLCQKLYFIDEVLAKFRGVNSVYAQIMNSWREKVKRKTWLDMWKQIWSWKTLHFETSLKTERNYWISMIYLKPRNGIWMNRKIWIFVLMLNHVGWTLIYSTWQD